MGFFTSFLEYVSFETQELGIGSPDWHEAEVQGGEGFDIGLAGRRADLLATAGEGREAGNQTKSTNGLRTCWKKVLSVLLDLEF
jgi:hypothetical protein